jgi:hypothetical protein
VNSADYDPPLYSTVNATTELCDADESCEFNGVGVSNSVWYRFISLEDGFITVDTNGSSYDTVLSIFDGCPVFVAVDSPCLEPTEVACDDDSGIGLDSQITDFFVQGGVEYFIKVADYNLSDGGGMLDFNLQFTAVGDTCDGDITGDGLIDVNDLLFLLGAWGACP